MGVRMPPLNTNHTMDVNAVFRIAYNNHVIPVPELEVNGHFRFFKFSSAGLDGSIAKP